MEWDRDDYERHANPLSPIETLFVLITMYVCCTIDVVITPWIDPFEIDGSRRKVLRPPSWREAMFKYDVERNPVTGKETDGMGSSLL